MRSQVVPNIDWIQNYSEKDQIENVPSAIDAENSSYITGYTYFSGTKDFTTIKYDSIGNLKWVRHYDGLDNLDDQANAIVLDNLGNIYIVGQSNTTVNGNDFVTIKYSSAGVLQWVARFNGSANSEDIPNDIVVDNNGNVFVTGKSINTSGNFDFLTIKYGSNGIEQWVQTHAGSVNGDDESVAIALGINNDLYITGNANNIGQGLDITTIRYDKQTGSLIWLASKNGSSSAEDRVFDLLVDGNNILVCGFVSETATNKDYYVSQINLVNGSINWEYNYNSLLSSNDLGTSIIKNSTGNYVLTGISELLPSIEYHTIAINNIGEELWIHTKSIGLTNYLVTPKIKANGFGESYICGEKMGTDNDFLVYELSSDGVLLWEDNYNGNQNGQDVAVDMVVNSAGDLFVTGQSQNSNAKFDYTTIKYKKRTFTFSIDPLSEALRMTSLYYENKGQLKDMSGNDIPKVRYYTINQSESYFIEPNKIIITHSQIDEDSLTNDTVYRIDMNYAFSTSNRKIYHFNKGEGHLNYYRGDLPKQGVTKVNGFDRLIIPDLYKGVDLQYSNNKSGIKYYFEIKPDTGSYTMIQINFSGANSVNITGNNLVLNTALGEVTIGHPTAYQLNSLLQPVIIPGATWAQTGINLFGFNVPTFNPNKPLFIMISKDPPLLAAAPQIRNVCWSTFFGGSLDEDIYGIDVDTQGNQYITGETRSDDPTFPVTTGVFDEFNVLYQKSTFVGAFDLQHMRSFVTFFSGAPSTGSYTVAHDIKVKSNGDIIIGGYTTASDLPVLPSGSAYYDGIFNGGGAVVQTDGFLARFNNLGIRNWCTFFGGDLNDRIKSIDFDDQGNLYITGYGKGQGFPILNPMAQNNTSQGAIIAKFDNNYTQVWASLIGGAVLTDGQSIHCKGNSVYVCGETQSTNFPLVNPGGGYVRPFGGGQIDYFLAEFSTSNQLLWSTNIGGSDAEFTWLEGSNQLASDDLGNLYFAGSTMSLDFETQPFGSSYFNNTATTNTFGNKIGIAFLMKFNRNNRSLDWSTFIEGTGGTKIKSVVVSSQGDVFLGGYTIDTDLPYFENPIAYYDDHTNINSDGVIINFSGWNRQFNWLTAFGGLNNSLRQDFIYDLALTNDFLYAVGYSGEPNSTVTTSPFPTLDPGFPAYFEDIYSGDSKDGFITKFCIDKVLGIDNLEENSDLLVYPNPTAGEVTIVLGETNSNTEYKIRLYDISGKLIIDKKVFPQLNQLAIDLTNFATGSYILQINTSNFEIVKTLKIIKY